jgi:hypothetical protein
VATDRAPSSEIDTDKDDFRGHAPIPEWTYSDRLEMDAALARIIASAIHHFRTQEFYSHPEDLDPDRWNAVLREIEEGFRAYVDEVGYPYMSAESTAKFESAMALFAEYFPALWN